MSGATFDCSMNPAAKFGDALRKDCNTTLAGGPISRGKIVQYLNQPLFAKFSGQDRLLELVGEKKFHALESCCSRGSKALQERPTSAQGRMSKEEGAWGNNDVAEPAPIRPPVTTAGGEPYHA